MNGDVIAESEAQKVKELAGLLGRNIRRFRIAAGLTQKQLATQVGRSVRTVQRWESSLAVPDAKALRAVAKALGIKVLRLLTADERKARLTGGHCHQEGRRMTEEQRQILKSAPKNIWYMEFAGIHDENNGHWLNPDTGEALCGEQVARPYYTHQILLPLHAMQSDIWPRDVCPRCAARLREIAEAAKAALIVEDSHPDEPKDEDDLRTDNERLRVENDLLKTALELAASKSYDLLELDLCPPKPDEQECSEGVVGPGLLHDHKCIVCWSHHYLAEAKAKTEEFERRTKSGETR